MSLFDPPVLETKRLLLSPFAAGDEEAAQQIYRGDEDVTRFVGWPPLRDDESARGFVEVEARAWTGGDACRGWLARERESRRAVGAVIARRHDRDAEFSYVVDKALWGQGFASEMARAVAGRARTDPELDELWAVCDVEHAASARVLERAGFEFDRTLPQHGTHRGFAEKRDCKRYVLYLRGME